MSFFGKYRGKVVMNLDPLQQGRIVPLVPAVSEFPLSWALPSTPYGGPGVGFFALPPIGANVWIEFEQGDANHPVWSGCFWAEGEAPARPAVPTTFVMKTQTALVQVDDLRTEVTVEVVGPAGVRRIQAGPQGITIACNEVTITVQQAAIQLTNVGSKASVAPSGVKLTAETSTIDLSAASLEAQSGGARIDVSAEALGLQAQGARVDLAAKTVSLNGTALQVT